MGGSTSLVDFIKALEVDETRISLNASEILEWDYNNYTEKYVELHIGLQVNDFSLTDLKIFFDLELYTEKELVVFKYSSMYREYWFSNEERSAVRDFIAKYVATNKNKLTDFVFRELDKLYTVHNEQLEKQIEELAKQMEKIKTRQDKVRQYLP